MALKLWRYGVTWEGEERWAPVTVRGEVRAASVGRACGLALKASKGAVRGKRWRNVVVVVERGGA